MEIIIALMEAASGPEVIGLIGLMMANVILSITASLYHKEFAFRNLGDFVLKRALPLVTYIALATISKFSAGWDVGAIAVYVGLVAMYGSGIAAAVKSLTGISIPNIFSERR